MSDKQIAATGEEEEKKPPRDEKSKGRRRRRKKPKPEQADGVEAPSEEKKQSSERPKRKKRPPGSKPRPPRPDEESSEGTSRPPRRKKKKKPKPKAPPEEKKPQPPVEEEDEVLLQWSVHLFKRRRGISALVVGMVIMATYFGYWLFHEWFLSVIVVLISVGALSAYFFPISYTLSQRGMKMKNFLAREDKQWHEFWTYVHYPDGVLLAYDQRKLKGRVRQGVMLYYDDEGELKDKISEIVSPRLPSPEEVGAFRRKK